MSEVILGQWPDLNTYKVKVLEDRYDGESERITRLYKAFGKVDARLQAEQDYKGGTVLTVELEPSDA